MSVDYGVAASRSDLSPYEPIIETCAYLDSVSDVVCDPSCRWYHGTWQYLRILDVVCSPTWHADFFQNAIGERFSHVGSVDVLISGCADYGMLAQIGAALGGRTKCTAVDLCRTPLIATAWYARVAHLPPVRLVQTDATRHRPENRYDLIACDGFLPRVGTEGFDPLFRSWRRSLRPGGLAVTTVRIHDISRTRPDSAEVTARRWQEKALDAGAWWPPSIPLSVATLAGRAADFARRDQRERFYDMQAIRESMMSAGFENVRCDVAETRGGTFACIFAS